MFVSVMPKMSNSPLLIKLCKSLFRVSVCLVPMPLMLLNPNLIVPSAFFFEPHLFSQQVRSGVRPGSATPTGPPTGVIGDAAHPPCDEQPEIGCFVIVVVVVVVAVVVVPLSTG
jgi:hypothetical protein